MKSRITLATLILLGMSLPLQAAETAAAPAAPATSALAAAPAMPAGLIPLNDYKGDLLGRQYITGDWGGTRTELANKGIQLEVDWTQVVQGVANGGKDIGSAYGGSLDYLLNVDLHRMGVMPGAMLTIRAESRYGEAINSDTGALIPANSEMLFPLTQEIDDQIAFTITTLRYTQMLSETFGAVVGKFDTMDVSNEFSGGRGVQQFMNGNFVFPTAGALTVPYSTLGAGIVLLPVKNLMITSLVVNTDDSSTTTGFSDFGKGYTWITAATYQYQIADLPGGQGVTIAYCRDRDFTVLGGGLVFQPGQGLTTVKTNDSWFVCWDTWQYLWTPETAKAPINIADGKQDLQGIGFFTRVSFADQDTNPIKYTLSGGLGAKGLIPSRENDTFGVAYAYNRLQDGRISNLLNLRGETQAFECFYNVAVTPATHLTFDLQLVDALQKSVDTALVLGARLNIKF